MPLHAEAATVHAKCRALRFPAVDIAQHLAAVRRRDKRPHFVFRRLVQTRPDAQGGNLFFQPGAEVIGGFIPHRQHHRERHAALPRRTEACAHNGVGGHFHVGIRHENTVVFRATQCLTALSVGGRGLVNVFGNRRRADKAHRLHARVGQEHVN